MNNISYKVRIESDSLVSVELSKPLYKMKNIKINNISGDFIDSGAKHFVCNYKDDWNNGNIINQMKEIRFNELFKPYGVNVNYYKVIKNFEQIQFENLKTQNFIRVGMLLNDKFTEEISKNKTI